LECSNVNINPTVNKGGRPTVYKPEYNDQAYKLCLLGATDEELADFFGVDERTINDWKLKHEGFFQSLRAGKTEADANVADKLYKVATGYEHEEDVIMQYQGQPVIVPTTKHYAPDTKAASLWLRNRRPDKWTETTRTEVTGTITHQLSETDWRQLVDAAVESRQRRLGPVVEAEYEVKTGENEAH
jgi:hypothetical protein